MAEGSRALPDLIARIRLDSSGVDEAVTNLTGSFGKANLAMAGVAAGLGIIVAGAKSMIDIAIAQDAAQADLNQAWKGSVQGLIEYRAGIDAFIAKNQPFIKSQSETIEGFAKFTREGLDTQRATRDMGLALDYAAVQHVSLTDAVNILLAAENGRFKGLIPLGIKVQDITAYNKEAALSDKEIAKTTAEVERAQDALNLAHREQHDLLDRLSLKKKLSVVDFDAERNAAQKVSDAQDKLNKATDAHNTALGAQKAGIDKVDGVFDQLIPKLQGGRDTTSELSQNSNILRGHWETLANKTGPGLVGILSGIVDGANHVYDALDRIGKDDALWKRINDRLVTAAGWFADFSKKAALPADAWAWWDPSTWGSGDFNPGGRGRGRAAGGGPVLPNSVYEVGEQGPETLVMGGRGGMVIPHAGADDRINKVTLANDRQGDMVTLLARLVRVAEAGGPSFSTAAYGRS